MVRSLLMVAAFCGGALAAAPAWAPAWADEAQEACKKAMNDRIQVCTDDCTHRALAAASDYKDVNNNVKFGCLKGCALRQVLQMRSCTEGGSGGTQDSVETNRH